MTGQGADGAALSVDEVEALIRLAEYHRKERARQVRARRLRKVGLASLLLIPGAGPFVGDEWARQERKGWQ